MAKLSNALYMGTSPILTIDIVHVTDSLIDSLQDRDLRTLEDTCDQLTKDSFEEVRCRGSDATAFGVVQRHFTRFSTSLDPTSTPLLRMRS